MTPGATRLTEGLVPEVAMRQGNEPASTEYPGFMAFEDDEGGENVRPRSR